LFKIIWHTFDDASLYILFGIFLSGVIQALVNQNQIVKHLGKSKFKSVLMAALFGVPLPLCSCGVIPTAMSLRKNGASKGATLSFLISTPETGVDSIAISYALLDPIMTIFRPLAAFLTAIIAGISENIFGKKDDGGMNEIYDHCCDEEGCQIKGDPAGFIHKFRHGMRYAFVDLLDEISRWLLLGIVIAGVISYFVPDTFIMNYLGSGWQSMLIMLVVGIPLYVCASASTPIAASLILKGMSPGAGLVFLLAGPATNVATILMVGKFLGKRSAIIYLVSISICAIAFGLLLNYIYRISGIDVKAVVGKAGDVLPHYLKTVSSIVLIALMIRAVNIHKKV